MTPRRLRILGFTVMLLAEVLAGILYGFPAIFLVAAGAAAGLVVGKSAMLELIAELKRELWVKVR